MQGALRVTALPGQLRFFFLFLVNTQHITLVPKLAASGPAEEEAVCSPLGGHMWVWMNLKT